MYTYFVSYAHGHGFGMVEIFSPYPLNTMEKLMETRLVVAKKVNLASTDIVILNFQLLSGPEV